MMWFTSSWFNQLTDSSPEVFSESGLRSGIVRYVIFGGRGTQSREAHIEKIKGYYPEITLINGYGPTENTTFSLTYQINEIRNPIPIGRPLNNRSAYILSKEQQLVQVGVSGEICVGGPGLARGYLNRAELTGEKFIKYPFSANDRLYKSGYLGKWLFGRQHRIPGPDRRPGKDKGLPDRARGNRECIEPERSGKPGSSPCQEGRQRRQ